MNHVMGRIAAGITVLAVTSTVGCMGDPRISNQGGGNIITAVTKLQNNQLTGMTPDEVQIVTDLVSDRSPDLNVYLNDDQAAAITAFIQANNINSLTDAQTLANEAITIPGSVIFPDGFIEQIETIDVDLEALGQLDPNSLDFSNLF